MSSTAAKGGRGAVAKACSKAVLWLQKAGLQFQAGRIARFLTAGHYAQHVGSGAPSTTPSSSSSSTPRLLGYEGLEVINSEGGTEDAEAEAEKGRLKQEDRDSYWKMMKKYIGSDVTSIVTLPIITFEPMTMLQKMAELQPVDQMCRYQSRGPLIAEESLAAKESLTIYCKPVELYNILQRRAIRNRCLHYKIQAKAQMKGF